MPDISPEWITAISTAVYMLFTGWLIWESRKARKMQEEPQIDAYFQRGDDCNSKLYLVIKNNGKGGAHDIQITLKEDFETLKDTRLEQYRKLSYQGPIKNGISFLPPEGKREMLLGIFMGEEFTQLLQKTIDLIVRYKNVSGNKRERQFCVSFAELENTFHLPENPLYDIAKQLEKVSKKISDIASGWAKMKVITQTKDEYVDEMKELHELTKKQDKLRANPK